MAVRSLHLAWVRRSGVQALRGRAQAYSDDEAARLDLLGGRRGVRDGRAV